MFEFLIQVALATPRVAVFALFALGIVLIYRASRVLNLAHGAMAMLPAYVTYTLQEALHLPVLAAVALGVLSGALLGMVVEIVFIRRLRRVSTTAQTVGTVAVFGLTIAVVSKVWGSTPIVPPSVFPEESIAFAGSSLKFGELGLIGVAIVLTVALFALLKFTSLGLAMRGAADNRRAAALMGINPERTTLIAWMLGGALAAVAGILLSATSTLDPYALSLVALPGFVAALLGGLESMPGALFGAMVVGFATGLVPALASLPGVDVIAGQVGATQAALTVIALVVMARRGERLVATDVRSEVL
jgi:branched-chain amino acid transport system permease protein